MAAAKVELFLLEAELSELLLALLLDLLVDLAYVILNILLGNLVNCLKYLHVLVVYLVLKL